MRKLLTMIMLGTLMLNMAGCSETTNGSNTDGKDSDTSGETTNIMDTSVTTYTEYEEIFSENEVIDINIEINENDLQDMFDNALEEEYYSVDITVDGVTVENVGMRTKGNSSLMQVASSDSDRYGFKIKTDEYVDDQTLLGLDMLVLNASFSDASYMREYLTYTTAEELGLKTPNLVYTNLYINGELFGFYLCIEAYDDAFVESITDDEDAILYKADGESCTLTENDDLSGFEVKYGDDELDNLENLVEVLNNTTEENKEELEVILDVDSVLKNIALNTVMGNADSYYGSKAHNYYLLYSDGQFEYIGWDYNMSIGGFPEDNGKSISVSVYDPYYNSNENNRPLFSVLLAIEDYNDKYLDYVNELYEILSDFEEQVDEVDDLIAEFVANDPTAFYDYDSYLANITLSGNSSISSDLQITNTSANTKPELETETTSEAPADDEMMQRPGADENMSEPAEGMNERPGMGEERAAPAEGMDDENSDMMDRQRPDGQVGMNNMGGNGISVTTISIVDYITARLEFIGQELNIK